VLSGRGAPRQPAALRPENPPQAITPATGAPRLMALLDGWWLHGIVRLADGGAWRMRL
jgi:hypothetical protein